jgi:hypothetical protein
MQTEYVSLTELAARGWSSEMVGELLAAPSPFSGVPSKSLILGKGIFAAFILRQR